MMIENINIEEGTFELHGQVIHIPEGVDILEYIDSEVIELEVSGAESCEDTDKA